FSGCDCMVTCFRSRVLTLGLALGAFVAAGPSLAQSPESDVPAGHPVTTTETERWVFPEIPDKTLDELKIDTKLFSLHWGLCVIGDYTAFQQNDASLAQVGKQDDQAEFRSFRAMLRGQVHLLGTWTYLATGEYKGFDSDPDGPNWQLTDLWFSTKL